MIKRVCVLKVKTLNILLPTLSYLHTTQPHLYGPDLMCPRCHNEPENWSHVMLCKKDILRICIETMVENMTVFLEPCRLLNERDFINEFLELRF